MEKLTASGVIHRPSAHELERYLEEHLNLFAASDHRHIMDLAEKLSCKQVEIKLSLEFEGCIEQDAIAEDALHDSEDGDNWKPEYGQYLLKKGTKLVGIPYKLFGEWRVSFINEIVPDEVFEADKFQLYNEYNKSVI